MNDRISQIITVVLDNKVLVAETNYSEFHRLFKEIEPKMYHYRKFLDEVKNKDDLIFSHNEKTYYIHVTRNKKNPH